jgi:hypothetical protein
MEIRQLLEDNRELMEVLGMAPGEKVDGTVRLLYENVNGLQARVGGNIKLDKIKTIIKDLSAEIFAFNEHRNILKHRENWCHGINHLFYWGEAMVRGVWSSNQHEKVDKFIDKRTLEGGTGIVSYGEMAGYMDSKGSSRDSTGTGLGQWTYLEFRGCDRKTTMVLTGYVPCRNKRPENGTIYQQHRRYYIDNK